VSGEQGEPNVADAPTRRRTAALAGHQGNEAYARAALADTDASVRATALGALARLDHLSADDLTTALADPVAAVRGRAAELAAKVHGVGTAVLGALADSDATVAEVAAWALGEITPSPPGAIEALSTMATQHEDALCREAAVAALGALGAPAGLDAILAATKDKPAVRRRAVLALAPFEGPEVDAALTAALDDRDWQVRQAAEDLGARRGDVPPRAS
jgi:HEAT repeat protein